MENTCFVNLKDTFDSYNLYAFNTTTRECTLLNVARGFQFSHLYLDKNLVGQSKIGLYQFTFKMKWVLLKIKRKKIFS